MPMVTPSSESTVLIGFATRAFQAKRKLSKNNLVNNNDFTV